MNIENQFNQSDLELELDPLDDAEQMRSLAKQIFDRANPKVADRTDASKYYGRLFLRKEGKSGTTVYQLNFQREKPRSKDEDEKHVTSRYIIRIYRGNDKEDQYTRELNNIKKMRTRGKDFLSCELMEGKFCIDNTLVIRHAEDEAGGGKLQHLHKIIHQSIDSPHRQSLLQTLMDFMRQLTSLYDGLDDAKIKQGKAYFAAHLEHRLLPDLFLDASQHSNREIVWTATGGGTLLLHRGGRGGAISPELVEKVDPQTLLKEMSTADLANSYRYGIQLEVTESHLPVSTPSILKLKCGFVRFWVHTTVENMSRLRGKTVRYIALHDFANLRLGHQQLTMIGFPEQSCISSEVLEKFCEQVGKRSQNMLTLRYRHNDLHSENVLASAFRQKLIDIGAAWHGLIAVDCARLEHSLWLRVGETLGIVADEAQHILSGLEKLASHPPASLSSNAKYFYGILLSLRSGARGEGGEDWATPAQEALAYVQEAVILQRYYLEDPSQKRPTLFPAVAAYWISRLRHLLESAVEMPAPWLPVREQTREEPAAHLTPKHPATPLPRLTAAMPTSPAAESTVVGLDKAVPPTLHHLWEAALTPLDANSRELLFSIEQQDGARLRSGLTDLQQALYSEHLAGADHSPFTSDRNVIIAAPTSSGKTTVSEMFLVRTAFSLSQCALYIAPTKALAQARHRDLCKLLATSGGSQGIVLSTADDTKDDWRLTHGKFSIACLVYEKANILFSRSSILLSRVGCLVIDEIHMLADLDRGPILELVLSKAVRYRNQLARKSSHASTPQMKIVAISTENALNDSFLHFLSARRPPPALPEKPLIIAASGRPHTLDHYLLLRGDERRPYTPFFLKSFENDQGRLLNKEQLTKIDLELYREVRRLDTSEIREPDDEREKRLIQFLLDELTNKATGCRTLVFIPGKTRLHRIASQLQTARIARLGSLDREHPLPQKFLEALKRAEDLEAAKLIERCAKARIFVHHSDIPVEVRREIEVLSAEPLPPSAPSEVLLATETLSYGVNLAISSVVVLGTVFPSSTRMREPSLTELSPAAFHNMTGRCGRLGKMTGVLTDEAGRKKAHAQVYVVVTWDPRPRQTNPYRDIVQRYYCGVSPVGSQLFLPEDKAALQEQDTCLLDDPEPPKLTSFSYPFVRSVLDALGHLNITSKKGGGAKVSQRLTDGTRVPLKEVIRFFDTSLFVQQYKGGTADGEDDSAQKERLLFRNAVESVLKLCAEAPLTLVNQEREPELLRKHASRDSKDGESKHSMYLLTARGRAIIDTGTEIASIEPLLTLVGEIHRRWNLLFCDIPVKTDLYVLALVALEEIRRQNIGATPECQTRQWTNPMIAANQATVSLMFDRALTRILGKPEPSLSEELIKMLAADDVVRAISTSYPASGVDALLRCFSSVIAWINGRPQPEALELLEGPNTYLDESGYRVSWKQFTEQLSWKALFLAKLLATAEPSDAIENSPDVQRDLLLLVKRLRLGCTVEAIPLFWDRSVNLTRPDADLLKKEGFTPARILSSNMPWPKGEISEKRVLLTKSLCQYVIYEHTLLADEMTDPYGGQRPGRKQMQEYWNSFSEEGQIYARSVENFHSAQGVSVEFDRLLVDALSFQLVPSDSAILEAESQEAERDLQMSYSLLAGARGVCWHWKWPYPERPYAADMVFVGLELNHRWECPRENNVWSSLAHLLQRMNRVANLILVATPWLPSIPTMPSDVQGALRHRRATGQCTTVMTAASLGVLASSVARGLTTSNELTMRLLLNDLRLGQDNHNTGVALVTPTDVDGLFYFVGIQELLRTLSRKHLPPTIYERLIQQFEVRP